jgi:hypothetical protein
MKTVSLYREVTRMKCVRSMLDPFQTMLGPVHGLRYAPFRRVGLAERLA